MGTSGGVVVINGQNCRLFSPGYRLPQLIYTNRSICAVTFLGIGCCVRRGALFGNYSSHSHT